jgi:1,4-dihydroxy-2-naphthoyl-CoA hydrolase
LTFPKDSELWLQGIKQISENTASDFLGIEIVEIDDNHIVLTMPITDKARQPMGLLHGGINMVLAETAASLHSCWGVDLSEKTPVGIEINGSHVRSASEGTVKAVGKVIRRSRNFVFHQVDIYLSETEELLSTARVTNFYKEVKGDKSQQED